MAFPDAKRHIDRVRKGEPVNCLKYERQAQAFFQLHHNRTFITSDRHDVACPDLSLHHIALCLQEQLDRAVEFGFRQSRPSGGLPPFVPLAHGSGRAIDA